MSQSKVPPEYEKFFDPKRLRQNLLLGALYLATFEMLRTIIINDLISFFAFGDHDQDGKPLRTERYRAELAKHDFKQHRDEYKAACLWLKDIEAVDDEEYARLLEIRAHRNQIAHELPAVLLDAKLEVNVELLVKARNFIHKLDRWWFENVEMDINPDLQGKTLDELDFVSGRMAVIDHVIGIASRIFSHSPYPLPSLGVRPAWYCPPSSAVQMRSDQVKVRATVFDSKAEEKVFRSLQSRWSSELVLYPSLPLAKLICLEEDDRLPVSEQRFFYQTNVDYTFCTPGGRPLFSVEFDGLGGGFSKVGVYIPHRTTQDRNRTWKLDTKLRFAAAVHYPLMVVSFEEARSFDDESMNILDGIIGQFLAKRKLDDYIEIDSEVWDEYEGLGEYGEWARDELIQDAVLGAEVQSKLENDPLARRAAQEHAALPGNGGYRTEWLYDPPLPDAVPLHELLGSADPYIASLKARIAAWQQAIRVGCRVTVNTASGSVVQTVWARNVGHELGVSPEVVVENAAKYLAFKRARAVAGSRVGDAK